MILDRQAANYRSSILVHEVHRTSGRTELCRNVNTWIQLKISNLKTYLSCHARRAAHCDAPPSLSSAATAARRWDTRPTHFLLHWCCSYDLLLLDLYTPTAEIKRPAPDFKYATMPGAHEEVLPLHAGAPLPALCTLCATTAEPPTVAPPCRCAQPHM